jgi:hypothetical protein
MAKLKRRAMMTNHWMLLRGEVVKADQNHQLVAWMKCNLRKGERYPRSEVMIRLVHHHTREHFLNLPDTVVNMRP